MLSDKDWKTAKTLFLTCHPNTRTHDPQAIFMYLLDLLSCSSLFVYSLSHDEEHNSNTACPMGAKITKEPDQDIHIQTFQMSYHEFNEKLRMHGGDKSYEPPTDLEEHGMTSRLLSSSRTEMVFIVMQKKTASSLILVFSPNKEVCTQKIFLLETLLPSTTDLLNRCLFTKQKKNPLSARELQILKAISSGDKTFRVACDLDITERTVSFHLSNIYRKLGARNRQEAICIAQQADIISPPGKKIRQLTKHDINQIGGGCELFSKKYLETLISLSFIENKILETHYQP